MGMSVIQPTMSFVTQRKVRASTRRPRDRPALAQPSLPGDDWPGARVLDTRLVETLLDNLPVSDNTSGGLQALLDANRELREVVWPEEFRTTTHTVRVGDACSLEEAATPRAAGAADARLVFAP